MQPAQKHACAQQPTQLKAPHPTEKAPQQVDRLACEGGGAADTGTPICATIWPKRCWRGTDPCQHSAPFNHPMCEVAVPVLPLSPGHSKLTRQNIQGTLQELLRPECPSCTLAESVMTRPLIWQGRHGAGPLIRHQCHRPTRARAHSPSKCATEALATTKTMSSVVCQWQSCIGVTCQQSEGAA